MRSDDNFQIRANNLFISKTVFSIITLIKKLILSFVSFTIIIGFICFLSSTAFAIDIDGNFNDWSGIEPLGTDNIEDVSADDVVDWKALWAVAENGTLYLSYETAAAIDFTCNAWRHNIFIDSDNDINTGYLGSGGDWALGADYLLQGASLFRYVGNGEDWSWAYEKFYTYGINNNRFEIAVPEIDLELSSNYTIKILLHADNPCIVDYAKDTKEGFLFPENLAGWWKFSENTQNILSDYSHNDNDGNIYGAAWEAGVTGAGLHFDGIDDYAQLPNSESLQLDKDLTLSFWIKPENIGNSRINPIDKSYGGEFALTIEPNGSLSYYHGTQKASNYYWGCYAFDAGTLVNNQWQYIVITRNSQTRTIKSYLNGELKKQIIYSSDVNKLPAISTYPVRIAKGYTSVCYKGMIDEVKIYRTVLASAEITKEYELKDTAADWDIDENSGARIYDAGLNENEGTIFGADWTQEAVFSSALSFDGIDDYIEVPHSDSLDIREDISIEAWVKFNQTTSQKGASQNIIKKENVFKLCAEIQTFPNDEFKNLRQGENSTPAVDKTIRKYGQDSAKFIRTTQGNSSIISRYIDLTGVTSITLHGYNKAENVVKGPNSWERLGWFGRWYDENKTQLTGWPDLGNWDGTFDWTLREKTLTVPQGAKYYKILMLGLEQCTGTGWWDDVRITDQAGNLLFYSSFEDDEVWFKVYNNDPNIGWIGVPAPQTKQEYTCYLAQYDYENGYISIYQNGIQAAKLKYTSPLNTAANNISIGEGLGGFIDKLTIQTKILSSQEAEQAYKPTALNLRLDENTGNLAQDSSPNENDGTITNALWNSEGVSGSCLSFDGDNDSVLINDTESLNFTESITLRAWIKLNNYPNNTAADIITKYNGGVIGSYLLTVLPDGTISFSIESPWHYLISNQSLALNTWYHITATFDGTTKAIYINGELDSQNTGGGLSAHNSPVMIGARLYYGIPSHFFTGSIDEVAIYNRALTENEILKDYLQYDDEAPIIHIASLSEGFASRYQSVNVSGAIDDNRASIEINGVTAVITDNTFTAEGIMLTPGQNTITAVATDLAGNASQDAITVTYTPNQSPYITEITPVDDSQLQINDSINIQITAQDPEGDYLEYQFKIDGEIKREWSAQNTYIWQTTSEDLGTHIITCEAQDDYCGFTTQDVSYEVVLELTPPSVPVVTDDGEYTTNNTELHASWISEDPQTGIAEYQYSIGTAAGTTDIVNWTTVGTNTEVTRTGLNLIHGKEYFFNVKALNGSGMISNIGYSNGIMINQSVPVILSTAPAQDSFYSGNLSILSITANDADGDPLEYQFSINDEIIQSWSGNSSYNWYPEDTDKGECTIKYEARDNCRGQSLTVKEAYIFYAPISPPVR